MTDMPKPSVAGMDEAALGRLDASVQADIDAGRHFGAALLVARGGKVVHRAELGTVAPNRPAARDDRYLLMSMSKAFTAVLVLRAIEQGRFRLDTRVEELLPGFGVGGKEKATVQQLLCHTSGLPTALIPPPLPLSAVGDLQSKVDAINKLNAVYEPGTRCVYTSGTGYDALGQILVATDPKRRSFRRIAKDDLFDPLGMQATSFGLPSDHPKRVPVSHTAANEEPSSPPIRQTLNVSLGADGELPAGGAFATIDDVFLFTEALIGRSKNGVQLLAPAMFDQARQNQTGKLKLEAIPPLVGAAPPAAATSEEKAAATAAKGGKAMEQGLPDYPANFTLLGGYVRGAGDYHNSAGRTATPSALSAVGGASTAWTIDTERDLTFIFLSAGFIEGFGHFQRVARLSDLAIAAVRD